MPPSRCHLTIKAPSLCAVEYTVSTASPPESIRSHLLHYLAILTRIVIGLSVFCALLEKLAITPSVLRFQRDFGKEVPWSRFGPAAALVLFAVLRRWYTGA